MRALGLGISGSLLAAAIVDWIMVHNLLRDLIITGIGVIVGVLALVLTQKKKPAKPAPVNQDVKQEANPKINSQINPHFNIFVSPAAAAVAPEKKAEPLKPEASTRSSSAASLQLSGISVFTDYSTVEAGRKLAFRMSFANKGPIEITDSRFVAAMAVTWDIPNEQTIRSMWDNLHAAVRRGLAETTNVKGPAVSIGNAINQDLVSGPLEESQASGLLNGTARVYLFAWVGWVGADGLKGEREVGLFLQKPQSKTLQASDMQNWGVCSIPVTPPLWE